ncbi:LacI family DNA-binding transcriptional regulator [Microbacterium sp. QXD-8]|uniref:LacI family DNA-binding transcriptional regulator n=1 Tax=Microbacterium psychrotolerans TaxID=3068321 RepID=A0ABU0YW25_9MICO|nr:LacI family DNA-binding transcriptional regulator [Microbacterium sp. QXD-8]MDQ7876538.1 LacI family DNA-binding transcriptional regulator [Microbacterium sp. QXD-8]
MAAGIRDVAELAKVSAGTVSKYLNTPHRVAPATSRRIADAIDALGYVRNDAARQLRAGRSRTIGLLAFDIANPFFIDLAHGVEQRAIVHGLSVLLGNSDENIDRESRYLDLFEEQRVHGVLVSPIGSIDRRIERFHRQGIPVVLLDKMGDPTLSPSVSIDDQSGGHMAVAHLISRGRTRIAFVGGPEGIRQVDDRLAGALLAVAENPGVTLEVIPVETRGVEDGARVGESLLLRPPAQRPDGIFAVNDRLAFGLLQTIVTEGNVRVPHDIAVIGYDDIEFAAAAVVPLSSIRQPREEFAAAAVDLLVGEDMSLDETQHPQIVLKPELVVRASTSHAR